MVFETNPAWDKTSRTFSLKSTTLIKRDRKLSLAVRNIFYNFCVRDWRKYRQTDRQTHFEVAHRHKNVVSIESLMIRKPLQKWKCRIPLYESQSRHPAEKKQTPPSHRNKKPIPSSPQPHHYSLKRRKMMLSESWWWAVEWFFWGWKWVRTSDPFSGRWFLWKEF